VLHVLLFLITQWFPISSRTVAQDQPEEVLQFTFNDVQEPDDSMPPSSEASIPAPEAAPAAVEQPPQLPEIARSGIPEPNLTPSPAVEAIELQPSEPLEDPTQPDDAEEALEEQQEQSEPPDPELQPDDAAVEKLDELTDPEQEAPDEASGIDVPTDEGSDRRQGVEAVPPPPAATVRPSETLDVTQALQSFRRDVARARANQPRPQRPPGTGTHENVFVPDPADLPAAGAPFHFLEHESTDFDFSDYDRQIYFAILKAWYNRIYATTADFEKWGHETRQWFLDHQAGVRFVIERRGDVTSLRLVAGSGVGALDNSAMDALAEVILPPLPAEFPRDQEAIRATFLMKGDILMLRPYFSAYKRAGVF